MSAAEDMTMQMGHGLTGIGTIIHDKPIAPLLETKRRRHFCRFQEQMSEHLMVLRPRLRQSRNGLPRHD